MKNQFLFLFILHFFVGTLFSQKVQHLANDHLKGKVKLCVEVDDYRIDSSFYSKDGFLMEAKSWDIARKKMSTAKYFYKDTLVEKMIWEHWGETEVCLYHYDSLNRCTLETRNGKPYVATTYDDRGNVTQYDRYRKEPYLSEHFFMEYDNQNRKIRSRTTYADSLMNTSSMYEYTDTCEIRTHHSWEGVGIWVTVDKGNTNTEYYFKDSISPSTLHLRMEWNMNSHDLVEQNTTERFTENSGSLEINYYEYVYDSMNNWIKRIATGYRNYTDTRSIIYYEP